MRDKALSAYRRVTFILAVFPAEIIPASTSSPRVMSRGTLSPVSAEVSNGASSLSRIPSSGTLSPGCTSISSPGITSSGLTLTGCSVAYHGGMFAPDIEQPRYIARCAVDRHILQCLPDRIKQHNAYRFGIFFYAECSYACYGHERELVEIVTGGNPFDSFLDYRQPYGKKCRDIPYRAYDIAVVNPATPKWSSTIPAISMMKDTAGAKNLPAPSRPSCP